MVLFIQFAHTTSICTYLIVQNVCGSIIVLNIKFYFVIIINNFYTFRTMNQNPRNIKILFMFVALYIFLCKIYNLSRVG